MDGLRAEHHLEKEPREGEDQRIMVVVCIYGRTLYIDGQIIQCFKPRWLYHVIAVGSCEVSLLSYETNSKVSRAMVNVPSFISLIEVENHDWGWPRDLGDPQL